MISIIMIAVIMLLMIIMRLVAVFLLLLSPLITSIFDGLEIHVDIDINM